MSTSKSLLQEIKALLLAEKIRLEAELSHFSHRKTKAGEGDPATDFPNFGDDEDENAAEVAQYTNNLPLENELENELRDVATALKRVDEGNYGVCKYCKMDIDEARLRARPTSTSCVACKKTLTQEL
jgi:DnaK suppressor protein